MQGKLLKRGNGGMRRGVLRRVRLHGNILEYSASNSLRGSMWVLKAKESGERQHGFVVRGQGKGKAPQNVEETDNADSLTPLPEETESDTNDVALASVGTGADDGENDQ